MVERQSRAPVWLRYDFAGYLLWLAGTLPLPVLVLTLVGPVRSASFYVSFTIAQAIDILSLNLGNTLTAELSRNGGVLTSATKSYLVRVWTAVGVLSALIFLTAPEVLQVFGDKYRIGGTIVLRTLMLATLPRSVLFIGIAIQRAREKGPSILMLQAIASVGTLSLGLVLTRSLGAEGTALAWATASIVAGLVTVFLLRSEGSGGSRTRSDEGLPGVTELPGLAVPASNRVGWNRVRRSARGLRHRASRSLAAHVYPPPRPAIGTPSLCLGGCKFID